jgi:uncharacterized protein YydD (DUF2326 family)
MEKKFGKEPSFEKNNLEKHFKDLEFLFDVIKVQKERLSSQAISGEKIPEVERKLLESREKKFKENLLEISRDKKKTEAFKLFIQKRKEEIAKKLEILATRKDSPKSTYIEEKQLEKKLNNLNNLENSFIALTKREQKVR